MKLKFAYLLVIICCGNLKATAQADSTKKAAKAYLPEKIDLSIIPKNKQTKNFGFFCKQELLLEKKLSLPVKLRLGNIEDCNYLEQKTGYKLPKQ